MELILKDLNWKVCLIYLDDIIVYGVLSYVGSAEDGLETYTGGEFETETNQMLPYEGQGPIPRAYSKSSGHRSGPCQNRGHGEKANTG